MTDYANKKSASKAARRQGYDTSMIDLHQNDAGRWEFSLKDFVMDTRSDAEASETMGDDDAGIEDEPSPEPDGDQPEPEAQADDDDPLAIPAWLRREAPLPAPEVVAEAESEAEAVADDQPPPVSLAEYGKAARERRGKGPVLAALRDAARPESERKENKQRGPFREGSRGKQLIDLAQRDEGVSIGEMKALGLKDPTTQLRDTAKRLGMKHRIVKGATNEETRYFVYSPEPEADEQPMAESA